MKAVIYFNLREICADLPDNVDTVLATEIECDREITCIIDEISIDGTEYDYTKPNEMAFQIIREITKELPIRFVLHRGLTLIKIKNALEDFFIKWADNDLPHLVVDYAVDHRVSADEVRADALREERTLNS